jgi:hypothetical protein
MANSGVLTLTGSGRSALAATTVLKEIQWYISTPGRTQFTNTAAPRRVMHAGWFALGYHNFTANGGTSESVMWWRYIDFEMVDYILPLSLVFGDSLWYALGNGVTVKTTVYW